MYSEKKSQVIENIKNMPDKETYIVEAFVAGFRAGKQTMKTTLEDKQSRRPTKQTA